MLIGLGRWCHQELDRAKAERQWERESPIQAKAGDVRSIAMRCLTRQRLQKRMRLDEECM